MTRTGQATRPNAVSDPDSAGDSDIRDMGGLGYNGLELHGDSDRAGERDSESASRARDPPRPPTEPPPPPPKTTATTKDRRHRQTPPPPPNTAATAKHRRHQHQGPAPQLALPPSESLLGIVEVMALSVRRTARSPPPLACSIAAISGSATSLTVAAKNALNRNRIKQKHPN